MSTFDEEPVLEPEELLDSSRLAAAWQLARERAAEPVSGGAVGAVVAEEEAETAEAADAPVAWLSAAPASPAASAASAAPASSASPSATPVIPPALPVAVAYRLFLDELRRLRAASPPELAAQAEKALGVPLEQLTATLDPLDSAAAEKLLDGLEDLLQSLLAAAEWPTAGEE